MQRDNTRAYFYDKSGKLMTIERQTGATNDVISSHALLDPRMAKPRPLVSPMVTPIVQPVVYLQKNPVEAIRSVPDNVVRPGDGPVLSAQLYKSSVSMDRPPIIRSRGLAAHINVPEIDAYSLSIGGITTATPLLAVRK